MITIYIILSLNYKVKPPYPPKTKTHTTRLIYIQLILLLFIAYHLLYSLQDIYIHTQHKVIKIRDNNVLYLL